MPCPSTDHKMIWAIPRIDLRLVPVQTFCARTINDSHLVKSPIGLAAAAFEAAQCLKLVSNIVDVFVEVID